jgi:hypothetical protein
LVRLVPGTKFLDKFLSQKKVPGTFGGMDAAVSIAIRQWRIDGVCRRRAGRDAGCGDL